jgi:hemerythrin
MEHIEWNDALKVNNPDIDKQHQKLLKLINEVYKAIDENKSNETTKTTIDEMENYINTHFTLEETMMKNAGYRGLEQHIKEHHNFVEKVRNFRERYEQGQMTLNLEVASFIKDWIINHIIFTDQKYKGKI